MFVAASNRRKNSTVSPIYLNLGSIEKTSSLDAHTYGNFPMTTSSAIIAAQITERIATFRTNAMRKGLFDTIWTVPYAGIAVVAALKPPEREEGR